MGNHFDSGDPDLQSDDESTWTGVHSRYRRSRHGEPVSGAHVTTTLLNISVGNRSKQHLDPSSPAPGSDVSDTY